jgi:hypothetical protein
MYVFWMLARSCGAYGCCACCSKLHMLCSYRGHDQRHATQPITGSFDGDRHREGHLQGLRPAAPDNQPRRAASRGPAQPHGAASPSVRSWIRPDPTVAGEARQAPPRLVRRRQGPTTYFVQAQGGLGCDQEVCLPQKYFASLIPAMVAVLTASGLSYLHLWICCC